MAAGDNRFSTDGAAAGKGQIVAFDFGEFEKVRGLRWGYERKGFCVLIILCQDAEQTQLLEEMCELLIVLKKDSTPQTIECLLMCSPLSSYIDFL